MSIPAVQIQDLCFGYEEREVLHNINLTVSQGDFAIVVGPNGGGKTTLLRLMLGLLEPRFGAVRIFGTPPEEARRRMAYVPQSLEFDHHFPISVLETALLGRLERYSLLGPRKRDRQIALEALAEVGLADAAKKPFAALSGGQRQRVLIAQALSSQPELLLLDEPGANLDAPGVATIYALLKELSQRITIVMVSHNLTMVEPFATHVVCVNHTADMHEIQQVSQDDLHAGNWVHIFHHECPVARDEQKDPCAGPHLGEAAHEHSSHENAETCCAHPGCAHSGKEGRK